ncbi:MAG TPA: protein kinase [Pyrinomonadaceae bacterium]
MDNEQDPYATKADYSPTPLSERSTLPQDDDLANATLGDRYRIQQKLGQGGFGAVYLACDEKMVSRQVVIKVLLADSFENDWSRKKFRQESEALTRIDHPNIVSVFDTGEMPDGKPYIVMQYVAGPSLRSAITAEGMELQRAAHIIRQIGRGLSAAHEKGIFHRDLKPKNIMLQTLGDGEEQVKVIDFGIAKVKNSLVGHSTTRDLAAGSIAYMSPEQLAAQPVSAASDIYAFGVIAFEILTGRRPFNPDSMFQLLEMQRGGLRVQPVDLRPSLSLAAQSIILKALAFAPADRYQQARQFGDDLAQALTEEGYEASVVTQDARRAGVGKPLMTRVSVPTGADASSLETANVLFTDIVGYSKLLIDEQTEQLAKLQDIVLNTDECSRVQEGGQLLRLPTGDGMALVFFGDPEAPLRCALEISRELRQSPELQLRMGIHSGLVYRVADINTNMNVAGGGINIAQRVMDCGDAGHILVSKRVADDLGQLSRWSKCLHDLGDAEVKHGTRVHIFNLYTDDAGNAEVPRKLQPPEVRSYRKPLAIAAGVIIVAIIVGGYAWRSSKSGGAAPAATGPGVSEPAALPERSLAYSLTVQKMAAGKPVGDSIESTGQEIYGNGWKFRFNVEPAQTGALYLLNEGPGPDGTTVYNILFPTPKNNAGVARISGNQKVQSGWNYFVDHNGIEKLWIIWATEPIADLDAIFSDAARTEGRIAAVAQIDWLKGFLKKNGLSPAEVKSDKSRKVTLVKGHGDVLVNLVELSHEAY